MSNIGGNSIRFYGICTWSWKLKGGYIVTKLDKWKKNNKNWKFMIYTRLFRLFVEIYSCNNVSNFIITLNLETS